MSRPSTSKTNVKTDKKVPQKKGREIIIKKAMQNAVTALAYVPKTRRKMSKMQ
jgi:hypothetical protein